MMQLCYGLHFLVEAAHRVRVGEIFLVDDLQGHDAIHADVAGLVDHAHAAAPQFFEHFIARDETAGLLGLGRFIEPIAGDPDAAAGAAGAAGRACGTQGGGGRSVPRRSGQ